MAFEVEGTNSAGDLGAAASVLSAPQCIQRFRNLYDEVRGAYEAITGLGVASQDYVNDNYMEYGVESSLNFPQFMFPFYHRILKRKLELLQRSA